MPILRIEVPLPGSRYEVRVGAGILSSVGEVLAERARPGPALVVTDENVGPLYLKIVLLSLRGAGFSPTAETVPAGEATKSLRFVERLYEVLLDLGADRSTPVLALGGGVVGDLSGFAAGTFLRGVPWFVVPTSLLAQVDASVGGKTGVNLPRGKNLAGAFYQPLGVLADVEALRTLPERHIRAGLAEVVKVGFGLSRERFDEVERDRAALLARDQGALARAVAGAVAEKARIVVEDEREGDRRRVLNLGHTGGHAIEAATGFGPVLHGEAVAVGLVAAGRAAVARGIVSPGVVDRVRRLLAAFGLPASLDDLPVRPSEDALAAALVSDKKRRGARIALVLPTGIGTSVIVEDGTVEEILAAL